MTVSAAYDVTTLKSSENLTGISTKLAHSSYAQPEDENSSFDEKHDDPDNSRSSKRRDKPVDSFLVKYRDKAYDIRDFMKHHPGGRSVLGYYNNRSLDKVLEENPHSKSAFHLLEEFALIANGEHEDSVNWSAPILHQVPSLADNYWDWVNLPVNRSIRLFRSDLLEYLSITPWYLVPIVWLPVCGYFLQAGYATIDSDYSGKDVLWTLISYVGGFLLWTITEYLLHRKLFHFKPPGNSSVLITLHFLLHGVHHKAPLDDRRLVFPPAVGLLVAKGFWEIYNLTFPRSMVYFVAAGTVTGYLCYDLTHYYLHHGNPKAGTHLYTMKRSHNYHHFSHHEQGFGISSRLWDHVFGTKIQLRQLPKPIEW